MRRTDLTASLSFKLQSTIDQFEVEHTNARCHLSRTFGSIADTFVIFLELSILIDILSIRSRRTQKHSLLFEVGLRGLYS